MLSHLLSARLCPLANLRARRAVTLCITYYILRVERSGRADREAKPPCPNIQATVDAKIVSGLFDRTTLPDECFKKVVSYMGSLEPRRPWRKPTTRANWKRGDVLT